MTGLHGSLAGRGARPMMPGASPAPPGAARSLWKPAGRSRLCGLDLGNHGAGDGPAVFVIFILGFLGVGLAAWIEVVPAPPRRLHAVIWLPVIFGLAVLPREMPGSGVHGEAAGAHRRERGSGRRLFA